MANEGDGYGDGYEDGGNMDGKSTVEVELPRRVSAQSVSKEEAFEDRKCSCWQAVHMVPTTAATTTISFTLVKEQQQQQTSSAD